MKHDNVNADLIINGLTKRIAELTKEVEIYKALAIQREMKIKELEKKSPAKK